MVLNVKMLYYRTEHGNRPIATYSRMIFSPYVPINLLCVFVLIPYHALPLPSVADPGCLSRIRLFPSRTQGLQDPGSGIRIKAYAFIYLLFI